MKITWIAQTYSVSLCCTPKHSLGLQDTPVIAGVEMAAQINWMQRITSWEEIWLIGAK